jgi:acetyl esterase
MPVATFLRTARMRAGAAVIDGMFQGLSARGRMHPGARPERHGVEVERDVPYRDGGSRDHLLDVYRPTGPGPHPVVLYVHGGGFRILSKDTHWVFGLAYARRGYLVFNISYRLAPRHPYPAAVEDACAAYEWVVANAARHGGDLSRLVLAGESAGANLVTALAVASCWQRSEPHASAVHATGVVPRAVVAACGILQVSDPERFARRRKLSFFVRDRIEEVTRAYLGGANGHPLDLADPLLLLEQAAAPARALPPFYAPVGTRDPILDDTRRLAAAVDRLGGRCRASYFPGELHAFHAQVPRPAARRCWSETFAFLEEALGGL